MRARQAVKCYLRSVIPQPIKHHMRSIIPRRLALWMEREPFRFSEDGLRTIHNCDFTESPRFIEAYRAGEATKSWGTAGNIRWRAYVVCWAAEQARHLPGDFVECGVNRGGFARMIIEYLGPGTFNR